VSCEREGHVGAEDSGNQPKYRCIYCGSWGYSSRWWTKDKEAYEECFCDLPYEKCGWPCEP
jgi:hypothetical protein